METKNFMISPARRRKLLLVLPLLLLPFLTMLFWAAGGGGGNPKIIDTKKGFNLNLPNAKNDDDAKLSKFNYYESAALDSAKMEELRKKDPNYITGDMPADSISGKTGNPANPAHGLSRGLNMAAHDPAEEKLYERLEQLKEAVRQPSPRPESRGAGNAPAPVPAQASADVQRLEEMMRTMQSNPEPEDREMQQINGMLENILDIQYPQRQQEKMRKASEAERGQVFPVQTGLQDEPVSILAQQAGTPAYFGGNASHNRFYSLDEANAPIATPNAVQATIAETQTIVNGATVKMKLGQDVFVNGTGIPANTFIFGTASLKGERLSIKVAGIRYGNSIYPVDLTVYDLDGLDGLYIPGAINRDVAKASADQSMQTLGVATLDDSWSAQAAGAGIEAAKSLFSKKVKLVKVVVKAGYQVLLRDEKQKDKS